MLYIVHAICISIWLFGVMRKEKYSWHAIINAYFIFLLAYDIPDVIFFHFFRFYVLPTHLLSDFNKDCQLGLIFGNGIILPFTGIIFCHYATKTKNHWLLPTAFSLMQSILEVIYLSLGYLLYNKWNILLSFALYFIGFRIFAKYASRIMRYTPPISYSIKIAASIYSVTGWVGAVFDGELIRLYEWRPHIFKLQSAENSFPEVSTGLVLALLSAIIIPKTPLKYRPIVFAIFAALAVVFYYFSYGHGWLIYHRWNHFLTALRWFVPIVVVMWFDRWESNYLRNQ